MTSDVLERVAAKLGSDILESSSVRGEAAIALDAAKWPAAAKWLNGEGGFSFLSDLCGVDRPGGTPRFEVVVNLLDMQTPARLRVKVRVPDGDPPKLPSVTSVWPTANWMERETYDMYGIVFEGHPNLERLLMPDEWEGHPLRKDYAVGKVPVEYKHLRPGF